MTPAKLGDRLASLARDRHQTRHDSGPAPVPLDDLRPIAFPEDSQAMAATDERLASVGGHWLPAPGNLDGLGMSAEKLMVGVLP